MFLAAEEFKKVEKKIKISCMRNQDALPYIVENGCYNDMKAENISWWTNGFWAGMLWQMYHATQDKAYCLTAEKTEAFLDEALGDFNGLHHDVGFMWLLSAVADFRLTQNEKSRTRGLHAATLLAGRYNPDAKFIRAWNLDKTGWMIIDTMMNLPLLYWAAKETNDPRFEIIARHHADTAMRVLQRPDGSVNHIAVLNPTTGDVVEVPGGQGYASGSSWSRGQSWAIYGFALSAYHTGKTEYLDAAKRAAHYFIAQVSLTDFVPLVDFRAPKSPVLWDTSASTIAACGLLQLAEMLPQLEADFYKNAAIRLLEAIATHHCDYNPDTDGIVQNATAAYQHKHTHASIIYADYYYVEALLRLEGTSFFAW